MFRSIALVALILLCPFGFAFAQSSFNERCNAPGVVLCVGFEDSSEIDPYLRKAGDGVYRGTLDTSVKASGSGSLRFEIPGKSGANSAGGWMRPWGPTFAENSTFYVQFRQRFSPEMLSGDMGGGGWKQVIFMDLAGSCANVEITTNNPHYSGKPRMYSRCGSDGFRLDIGNFDFLYQWSEDWPQNPHPTELVECHYQNQNPPPQGGCFHYTANNWMTFYYEVHIGNWGQWNSYVKAWVSNEGEPLKQFINNDPWRALQNTNKPDSAYRQVYLLPYDTGKSSSFSHPTAYTWYDEVIVSTQPIADPVGSISVSPGDSQPPQPAEDLTVTIQQ